MTGKLVLTACGLAVLLYLTGGRSEVLWLLLLAAVAAGWLSWRLRFVGGRTAQFHAHGSTLVNRHEAGHVVAARRVGARVTGVQVGNGWGVTHVQLPRGASAVDDATIDYAGGYAAGSWSGCGGDLAHARRALSQLPPKERAAAEREARRRARQMVGGVIFDGGVASVAAKIKRTGGI